MPRARGQIDEQKSQAILQAAASLFVEKGAKASMSEIARRAGVSKQTLYNRFASKTEIGRDLAAQRSDAVTAPLASGAEPEAVLAAIAETLISKICTGGKGAALRGVALVSPEAPELARVIYDAGPGESVRRIAAWLKVQDEARRLSVPDPLAAAEMFTGMALGHGHLRSVLGLPHPDIADLPARARDVARRFVRAFAPE
ncbi:TetR/AcrR family transcriptional regulator [Brevundimonas sanguinis]|uniref:TetR/AcrR family transcriptional regulator n=1 Tax=Brevundimonas sanguinis TaxID=3021811 RepID=UPI002415552C|nr:TetR/AcrR family transcriptional regulator [Brevundimonas sp. NCCP 15609]